MVINMSYLWQEFNIKTFPAETLVFRDGVFCEDLSEYQSVEFNIDKNLISVNKTPKLPIHIIYIGEIAGNIDLNIDINAENVTSTDEDIPGTYDYKRYDPNGTFDTPDGEFNYIMKVGEELTIPVLLQSQSSNFGPSNTIKWFGSKGINEALTISNGYVHNITRSICRSLEKPCATNIRCKLSSTVHSEIHFIPNNLAGSCSCKWLPSGNIY